MSIRRFGTVHGSADRVKAWDSSWGGTKGSGWLAGGGGKRSSGHGVLCCLDGHIREIHSMRVRPPCDTLPSSTGLLAVSIILG